MYKLKQISSVCLTLIVGVVLMGHEMVPHHHHCDNVPCFTLNDVHDCCAGETSETHQTHQCPQESGSCSLEQAIVAPGNVTDDFSGFIQSLHPTDVLYALLVSALHHLSVPEKTVSVQALPYLITYHSITASCGLGLRAPPTV
ncbi:MAG: hypothetical protein LBC40_08595 [Dysgonamonadaceae bacterium]|jgi:hypothetical protein|nr:hypothetical protein [Dysgonamonadaceae bacterium]